MMMNLSPSPHRIALSLIIGLLVFANLADFAVAQEANGVKSGLVMSVGKTDTVTEAQKEQLGRVIEAVSSNLEVPMRLVMIGEGSSFEDFSSTVQTSAGKLLATKNEQFKGADAILIYTSPNRRWILIRQGANAVKRDGLSYKTVEKLVEQSFVVAKPETPWAGKLEAFLKKMGARIQTQRQVLKDAAETYEVKREARHNRIRNAIQVAFSRFEDLNNRYAEAHMRGAKVTPPAASLTESQAKIQQASEEIQSDPGEADKLLEAARKLLNQAEKHLLNWTESVAFVRDRLPLFISAVNRSMRKYKGAPELATLQQESAEVTKLAKSDAIAARKKLQGLVETLEQFKVKQAELVKKSAVLPPEQVQPSMGSQEVKPAVTATSTFRGLYALLIFVVVLIIGVMLIRTPEVHFDAKPVVPGLIAEIEQQLGEIKNAVTKARETLEPRLFPKPFKLPRRIAESLNLAEVASESDEDLDPFEMIDVEPSPLFRGSSQRRIRRAKIAYAELTRQLVTHESSLREAIRFREDGQWYLAYRAANRVTRKREPQELQTRIESLIDEIDRALNTGSEACVRLSKQLSGLEDQLEVLVEKGLCPSMASDALRESQESFRDYCFTLLNDPVRACQIIPRIDDKFQKLEERLGRFLGAVEQYSSVRKDLIENNEQEIGSPYFTGHSETMASENLRMVGVALNSGQIEYARSLLEKSEDLVEDSERFSKVISDAEEQLESALAKRREQLDSLRERIDLARDALADLGNSFDPESYRDVVELPGIVDWWTEHIEIAIDECESLFKNGRLLRARMLNYYLAEKQQDLFAILDQLTAKQFELESEREKALSLRDRLSDQQKKLSDYFDQEKAAVRSYARRLLDEATELFNSISLPENEEAGNWPVLGARLHECAQLYDLARNAAEDDIALGRRAWALQSSVQRNIQNHEREVEEYKRKGYPASIVTLANARRETLSTRFDRIKQQSFTDDSSRWQVTNRALESLVQRFFSIIHPIGKVREPKIFAQLIFDTVAARIKQIEISEARGLADLTKARALIGQAGSALTNGQLERVIDLAGQAEDEAEREFEKLLLENLTERDNLRIDLFGQIRSVQRGREKQVLEEHKRALSRHNSWLRSAPESGHWSLDTRWVRGMTLGLLDPLPDTTASELLATNPLDDEEEDLTATKKSYGHGASDPFAGFAASASEATEKKDPFSAFAATAAGAPEAFAANPMEPTGPEGEDLTDTDIVDTAVVASVKAAVEGAGDAGDNSDAAANSDDSKGVLGDFASQPMTGSFGMAPGGFGMSPGASDESGDDSQPSDADTVSVEEDKTETRVLSNPEIGKPESQDNDEAGSPVETESETAATSEPEQEAVTDQPESTKADSEPEESTPEEDKRSEQTPAADAESESVSEPEADVPEAPAEVEGAVDESEPAQAPEAEPVPEAAPEEQSVSDVEDPAPSESETPKSEAEAEPQDSSTEDSSTEDATTQDSGEASEPESKVESDSSETTQELQQSPTSEASTGSEEQAEEPQPPTPEEVESAAPEAKSEAESETPEPKQAEVSEDAPEEKQDADGEKAKDSGD